MYTDGIMIGISVTKENIVDVMKIMMKTQHIHVHMKEIRTLPKKYTHSK